VTTFSEPVQSTSAGFLKWLTPRRLRAQAIVVALCLWGVCAVDYATPGLFDRAGNIKFQDFLPIFISARLIARHRSAALYDYALEQREVEQITGRSTSVRVPNFYGPQVGLLFVPLATLPFLTAASVWVALSLLIYFVCVFAVLKRCPSLAAHSGLVWLSAIAFPPLFHLFVRAQLSALPLACFTAASLAFHSRKPLLAGVALGLLMLKPQFLVALPLIFLLARSWSSLAGLLLSAAAQLGVARICFGPGVMHGYFDMLLHPARWIATAELTLAPIQMHSLRSFWSLLVPWPSIALLLYVLSSLFVIAFATSIWNSKRPLPVRFSALVLAAVLTNPHLLVYDLLVLAVVILLLADYALSHQQERTSPPIRVLTYMAFLLPLFGPLARWTHIQLSVIAFTVLLWILWRSRADFTQPVAEFSSSCA
jgi:alpha-1,2-mannosyltransferase